MKYINLELSNLIGRFEHTMVQVIYLPACTRAMVSNVMSYTTQLDNLFNKKQKTKNQQVVCDKIYELTKENVLLMLMLLFI